MWYQVCHGEVFWVRSCSSCIPPSFSPYGKQALYGYADDSTLVAVVPFPGGRVIVVESLNSDLSKVSMWWDLWGMKLKASKTKTMIVSRSSKIHPQSTPIDSGSNCSEGVCWLCYIGCDAWCLDDLSHAPSLCFQICSSEAWYYWKVMASISWLLIGYFFLYLFAALSCRSWSISQLCGAHLLIPTLSYWTELSRVLFFSWRCFRAQPCSSTICNSVYIYNKDIKYK